VTLSEPVLRQSIDYPDSYPMSLLASLNARASVGSGKGTDRADRLSSLVFVSGQVKTRTSLMLQQDAHPLQFSEGLGRSYGNRSAPRMDSRTHRDENPYQSAEMNGTTGGVQGVSFFSFESSGEDQDPVGSPSVLIVLRTEVDHPCSRASDWIWMVTSWTGYLRRRRRVMFAVCQIM
jgi:hypothetical protein